MALVQTAWTLELPRLPMWLRGRTLVARMVQTPTDDPFRTRLRTVTVRDLYDRWRSLKGDGPLPPLGRFDPDPLGASGHLFTVEVDRAREPVSFRFLSVGQALAVRLGRPLAGELVPETGEEVIGALEGAYRRCARTGGPSYEYARFDLDDGGPILFERLLLPFSADGQTVTHLVGLVAFADPATPA
jgi:hypothetical protein